MAQRTQRAFALAAAIFFLVASVATSLGVIYVLFFRHDTPKTQDSTTSQSSQAGKTLAGFTPLPKVDSLQIIDTKVGTGAEAKAGSSVSVVYVGALASTGVIFDASAGGKPTSISLSQVIKGWQNGVPGMKVGGTRRLLIPAADGYGAQSPSASIPPNSDLVFDITLANVQ